MNEQANPSNDKAVQTGHIQTGCQNLLAKMTAEISPNALKQRSAARSSATPHRSGGEAGSPSAALTAVAAWDDDCSAGARPNALPTALCQLRAQPASSFPVLHSLSFPFAFVL